ncbi:MAG: hypothetical protein QOK11_499 [Pseudonocardiales bacterium]|nr:hypothetical protein [Pseudonocardiales bacterium]
MPIDFGFALVGLPGSGGCPHGHTGTAHLSDSASI